MGKDIIEREINLWDMFWAVCLKWRSMLVCAIIFAVLAGGFSYVGSVKQTEDQKNAKEQIAKVDLEKLADELPSEDRAAVEMYIGYINHIEEQKEYNEKSPLMKLNPSGFYKGEISFYIDNHFQVEYPLVQKDNNIEALVNMYKAKLNSDEFAESVNLVLGLEAKDAYGMEMIDCDNVYGSRNAIKNNYGEGISTISVYAEDKEECIELMKLVQHQMEDSKSKVAAKFGKHDLIVFDEDCIFVSDIQLQTYQRTNREKIQNYVTVMWNSERNFTAEQKAYLETYMSKQKNEEDEKENLQVNISKKLIVVGFLGGAFFMFAVWALAYVFSSKLRVEDDFEQIFGSKLLGNVTFSDKKKKMFASIDNIFEKLRHMNQRYFEKEEALDMIASNIRLVAKKTGVKKVVVTGATFGKEERRIAEEVENRLKKDGIEFKAVSPVLYNAESLEILAQIGHVVFVEMAEKTLYGEVAREIEICKQQEVDLVGYILLY